MVMPFSPKVGNAATGGSRWTTNAKHLPALVAPIGNFRIKNAATTNDSSNNASYFASLALRGAQTSITVADTWTTIASVRASGVFVAALSPTHTASHTPSIRITVDGTVYTFTPSAAQSATHRLCVGHVINGYSTSATDGFIVGVNSANDGGFESAAVGGYPVLASGQVSLITPESALMAGLPLLRFEKSLKVEAKCSLLSATAVHKQCGAVYRVDP